MPGKKKISEKDIKKAYEHHEMMDEMMDEEEDKMEEGKYEKEEKMRKLKAFGMAYRKMQGYKMMKGYMNKGDKD
jgi:hypothetical protein